MKFQNVCFCCFQTRGGYEVCPYCGHVDGTPNQPAYLLQPGVRLWGRYIIGTVLGIGGFGVTYRAFDTRLATVVAIKEFFPQNLASRIPGESKIRAFSGGQTEAYVTQRSRFLDEAKSLAKFNGDAHIVNVYDYFEDNHTAYIVMEYLDGETLKAHLAAHGGTLKPEQAAPIMEGLLLALSSIHQKGIIHRDVSPDNIFVLRDGRIKLLDFGAARFAVKDEWTQSVVVKKGYAPPEQYRSNMKQTERTDLYAAGATWYKMLTGVTPEESIERWEADTLQRPSALGAETELSADKAVMKAMALRPEVRFQNAAAMLAAVKGQTGFDFPEEELKKRRRMRRASIAFAALAVAAVFLVAALQLSKAPETIQMGPTLADMDIQPDSITVLVDEYRNEDGIYDQLADAFMKQYPQYYVQIITREYDELQSAPPDFSTQDGPTVFYSYYGNSYDNRADLSLLAAGLNKNDYYLLDAYLEKWKEEDGQYLSMPLGFDCYFAYGSDTLAAAKNVTIPKKITAVEQILEAYAPFPDGFNLSHHEMINLMQQCGPDIYADGEFNIRNWEKELREYVRLRKERDPNSGVYSEEYLIVGMASHILDEAQRRWPAECRIIPIEKDGKLLATGITSMCVNKNATQNQQSVGMLFLHFMLSEYGQNLLHIQRQGGLPLNRKAMEQYLEMKPALAEMAPRFDDMILSQSGLQSGWWGMFETELGYQSKVTDVDAVMERILNFKPEEE